MVVRGQEAGKQMGKAVIEMVHLMYQNNTAKHFYLGLIQEIQEEMKKRKIKGVTKNDLRKVKI